MIRGFAVALATLLAAGGLIACGGNDEEAIEAYAERLNAIAESFEAEGDRIGEAVSEAEEPEELERAFTELAEAAEEMAQDAEAIEPPSGVEDAHADLTAALRSFADRIGALEVDGEDAASVQAAADQLAQAGEEVERRLNEVAEEIDD